MIIRMVELVDIEDAGDYEDIIQELLEEEKELELAVKYG